MQQDNRTPEFRPIHLQAGAVIALVLAGIASFMFLYKAPSGFPVDDAYIHLVYAKNLANGHGFSFNQSEPSFGTTSPLWVFLIAIFIKWVEPVTLVRIINVFCLLGSTLLVFLMAHHDISERATSLSRFEKLFFPLAGSALFCFSGNLLWIYFCGMETPLFLFLGLLAIYLMRKEKPSMPGGAILGLLVLTRVTGGLLVIILLFYRLLKFRRIKELYPFFISGLVYAPFGIYFLVRFHQVFPTTMGGKLASNLFNSGFSFTGARNFMIWHIGYLGESDLLFPIMILTILISAILVTLFSIGKKNKPGLSLSVIIGIWALANILMHAFVFRSTYVLTPYQNIRYQVMIFPATALLLSYIFARLAEKWNKVILFIPLVAGILLIMINTVGWKGLYGKNILHLHSVHQAAAHWAKENLPDDARVACFDIGSLKFFSDRYVIDLGGLIDPSIHPYLEKKRTGDYLVKNSATHYIEMTRHSSDKITGIKEDEGKLYRLKELKRFDCPNYPKPVFLHSLGMKIYEIKIWRE